MVAISTAIPARCGLAPTLQKLNELGGRGRGRGGYMTGE